MHSHISVIFVLYLKYKMSFIIIIIFILIPIMYIIFSLPLNNLFSISKNVKNRHV